MFKFLLCVSFTVVLVLGESDEIEKRVVSISEDWVCRTKTNCVSCLTLTQCAWCNTTSELKPRCFSPKLNKDFCPNDTIIYTDHGLSYENNALCTCDRILVEADCQSPDAPIDAPLCSGRGECKCGRCVCDPKPDPDHPTKTIVGRYCQLDNFSCDGAHCNEGPYSFITATEPEDVKAEVEQPEVTQEDSDFDSKEELLP